MSDQYDYQWRILKYEEYTNDTWREMPVTVPSEYSWGPEAQQLGDLFGEGRFLCVRTNCDYPSAREIVVVGRTTYARLEASDLEADRAETEL